MRWPASGPEDISVAQIQDTESGAEIMHMAENGFCADGEQERMLAEGRDQSRTGACRSIPMAAAWPAASRSARRACAKSTKTFSSCAAGPKAARSPTPKLGYSQVYGAPGLSAVAILEA